jgi:putative ABC transport system permease protein
MRRLASLAFRNVFRNKRRTILTVAMMSLGCTGLILVGGFIDNLMDGFREKYIHSQTGHLQVGAKGYHDHGVADPFAYLLQDASSVQRIAEGDPRVRLTVPRLKFSGVISNEETSIPVLALGVNPVRETQMGNYKYVNAKQSSTTIIEGEDLAVSDPSGVILGKGLMKALNLKIGDTVTFITTRKAGTIDGAEYHVRGAFETIVKDFDDHTMKVNLESAQKVLDIPGQIHNLLIVLDKTEDTGAVRASLAERFRDGRWDLGDLGDLEIMTWEQQGRYYRQSREFLDRIFSTVQFVVGVIFFFSIVNTINMSVLERLREFGTMMAIGNSRWAVFGVIFLEAVFLGVIGSFLGILVGCGVSQLISSIGIELPPPPQATTPIIAVITLTPLLLIKTFLMAIFSAIFASLLPGWRASHFGITQALGYV